jgi:hypothetical protein
MRAFGWRQNALCTQSFSFAAKKHKANTQNKADKTRTVGKLQVAAGFLMCCVLFFVICFSRETGEKLPTGHKNEK